MLKGQKTKEYLQSYISILKVFFSKPLITCGTQMSSMIHDITLLIYIFLLKALAKDRITARVVCLPPHANCSM